MDEVKPRLKLITRREFDIVKAKYGFKDKAVQEVIEKQIKGASPLDVLALTIIPGSGLKILDVKILNEKNEAVFIDLLKTGITQ